MYHRIIHFTDTSYFACVHAFCFHHLYELFYAGRIWLLQSLVQSVRAGAIYCIWCVPLKKLYSCLQYRSWKY